MPLFHGPSENSRVLTFDVRELDEAATYSICRCGGPLPPQRPQLMTMMASTDARMWEQDNSACNIWLSALAGHIVAGAWGR